MKVHWLKYLRIIKIKSITADFRQINIINLLEININMLFYYDSTLIEIFMNNSNLVFFRQINIFSNLLELNQFEKNITQKSLKNISNTCILQK